MTIAAAVLVLHVITTVTLSNVIKDTGVKITQRSERWLQPCAGGTRAHVVHDDVIIKNEARGVDYETKTRQKGSVDWNDTLKTLTDKIVRLKKRVQALKKLNVGRISFLS